MKQEEYNKNYEEFMSLFDNKFNFVEADLLNHRYLIKIGGFKKWYKYPNLLGMKVMDWGLMIKKEYEEWKNY